MKIISILMLVLAFAVGAFAQSYRTVDFNKQLGAITKSRIDYTAYDKLTKEPSAYMRKVAMLKMSLEDKVNIWTIQMAWALANESLTPEERKLVEGSTKFITPAEISNPSPEFIKFYESLKAVFIANPPLYRKVFEIPGNAVPSDGIAWYEGAKKAGKLPKGYEINLMRVDCNCNWSAGCENWTCVDTVPCVQVINCGMFSAFRCDYFCLGG